MDEEVTLNQNWDILTMNLVKVLEFEEGFRSEPYLDSLDYVTIGFGTKLHNKKGQNPRDFPIKVSRTIAIEWLHTEIAIKDLRLKNSPFATIYEDLHHDRQAIIMSMAYQLGTSGVSKFKKMWRAIALHDFNKASLEMLDSRWARQTPERAARHARVMRGDKLSHVYPNR